MIYSERVAQPVKISKTFELWAKNEMPVDGEIVVDGEITGHNYIVNRYNLIEVGSALVIFNHIMHIIGKDFTAFNQDNLYVQYPNDHSGAGAMVTVSEFLTDPNILQFTEK